MPMALEKVWVGTTPSTLQEWEEEGRKRNGASNVSPHAFLSLAGWRRWGAWQEKPEGIIFQTQEHKPNQRSGVHLLRMAGA